MWLMYVVWAFNAPNESRIAAYALENQCRAEQVIAQQDPRIKAVRCKFVADSHFRQN